MRILQINCGKRYEAMQLAFQQVKDKKVDILCMQEPNTTSPQPISHGGLRVYYPSGQQRDWRVGIAVRRDSGLAVEIRTDLLSHNEILIADIWELRGGAKTRRTRLVNVYDQDRTVGDETVRNLTALNWEATISTRTILLGDFNAHSPMWDLGCRRRYKSALLEENIAKYDLYVLNDGTPTHKPALRGGQATRASIIDLTIVTEDVGVTRWEVLTEEASLSDHESIFFELEDLPTAGTGERGAVTGWDIRTLMADEAQMEKAEAHWRQQVGNRRLLNDQSAEEEVEQEARFIEDTLTHTLNSNCKQLQITMYSKRWWNQDVRAARQEYNRVRRHRRKGWATVIREREAARKLHKEIRKAKREHWENFLDSCSGDNLWRAAGYTKPWTTSVTPVLIDKRTQPNVRAVTIEEKEDLALRVLLPPPPSTEEFELPSSQGKLHTEITEKVVSEALFASATKKAPGPSRLNFLAIRLAWRWDKERIVALVRQCVRVGCHPWKLAKGILLRKPKPDATNIKSYRVIALLECLGKVVEKVMATKIADWAETILHVRQMGGRRHRSAIDAVAILADKAQKAMQDKQVLGALLFDVKGAFDHVIHGRLLRTLNTLGADAELVRWVAAFLSGRRVKLVIDGIERPERDVLTGIPQGSPVSPILFLIYIYRLFPHIEGQSNVTTISYMDDGCILATGKDFGEVTRTLTEAARVAFDWAKDNGVEFDPDKTEAIAVYPSRGKRPRLDIKIQVGGREIQYKKEPSRWLGVWIDSTLTFNEHRKRKLQHAREAQRRLRQLTTKTGLRPGLISRLQHAVVQSISLYGAEVWWKGQKCVEEEVQRMVNHQARATLGVPKVFTPIGPLLKESGFEPAACTLNHRQRRYATRLLQLPDDHPAKDILPITLAHGDIGQSDDDDIWTNETKTPKSIGTRLAQQLGRAVDPRYGVEPVATSATPLTQLPYKVSIEEREKAKASATENQPEGVISLWTDGSRLEDGRVGAAAVYKDRDRWRSHKFGLGSNKEVFDAELYGIAEGLRIAQRLSQRREGCKTVRIFSDSQAALKAVQQAGILSQWLTTRIRERAESLAAQGLEVELHWVPGHVGCFGNEEADKAAKQAAAKIPGRAERFATIPYLRRQNTEQRKKECSAWLAKQCKKHRSYYGSPKIDAEAMKAPKKLAQRLFQLRLDVAPTAVWLRRMKKRDSPTCWHCQGTRMTRDHLIRDCPAFREARQRLWVAARQADSAISHHWPAGRILACRRATPALLSFLEQTGIGKREREDEEDSEWREVDKARGWDESPE